MIKNTKYGIINQSNYKDELIDKAKKIKLLAFDVDGVLTDGGIYIDQGGNEKILCTGWSWDKNNANHRNKKL